MLMKRPEEPMQIILFVLAMHAQCDSCQRQNHASQSVSTMVPLSK